MANAKLDVDIASFQASINAAKNVLKGLSAEMKAADATFKATGNAEKQLADKTKTLNSQLQVQKGIADQAKQALKAMDEAGVKPTDADYQKLYATMMNATAGMNEAQAALNGLGTSAQEAASGADQLTNSVNSIGKKISLEQVIGGIDRITSGLENAAKKAVDLGEKLWNTIMDSAKRADDTTTMAEMYGIDLDTFMKMQKLVTGGMDTSVEAMLSAQDKLKKGIGNGSQAVMGYLQELGLMFETGKGGMSFITDDTVDMFWQAGQAIMAMGDAYDQEAAAQALFGKSWKELRPLFNTYKDLEEYNTALDAQTVNTEETIRDLAALNDAVSNLEGTWTTLKDEMLGAIAPALTKGADAISGLLNSLTEYLKTEDGKKLLEDLGTAVSGLFDDLGKIDPKTVVENFTSVFKSLVSGLQWIVANKGTLISALEAVVVGWGGLKLTGGILSIIKLIDGLRSLGVIGGGAATATGAGGGLMVPVTAAVGNALQGIQSWISTNGGPIWDWLTHESPIGSVMQGTETWDQWWTRQNEEQAQRTESFESDWANNNIFKFFESGVETIRQNVENTMNYWKQIDNVNRIAAEWTLGDEYTADDIMQMINNGSPVPVEVAPTPEDGAAANIADQVGPITLPVEFQIRSDYVNLQQYILKQMGVGHANGLSYVPNEGLYHLHKGERVVPAREVASRSFSSNLYVENMNMGGGLSADALAAAIAGRNRRMMAGYGS